MGLNDFIKEKKWPILVALLIMVIGAIIYFTIAPQNTVMENAKGNPTDKLGASKGIVGNSDNNRLPAEGINRSNDTPGVLV